MASNPMPMVGGLKLAKTLPKALAADAVAALLTALSADPSPRRRTDWMQRDRRRESEHPIYRMRTPNRSATPVLTPQQVNTILDACATQRDGDWSGGPAAVRNRLLFAVLAETGMRLGEVLSLRHHDFHIGAGATPFIEIVDPQDHPHGVRVKTRSRRVYVGDDLEALYSEYVWQLVALAADVAVPDLATHFVFVNLTHGPRFSPLRVETVYDKVRAIKRANPSLPADWTPHWLRHTSSA